MPDVHSSIEVEGEAAANTSTDPNTSEGFENFLRGQVSANAAERTAPAEESTPDYSEVRRQVEEADGDEIVRGVLAPESGGLNTLDSIEFEDTGPSVKQQIAEEREKQRELGYEGPDPEVSRRLALLAQAPSRVAELEQELALRDFAGVLAYSDHDLSAPDVQNAALDLQRKNPLAFRQAMSVLEAEAQQIREDEIEDMDNATLRAYERGETPDLYLEGDERLAEIERLASVVGYARVNETNLLAQVLQNETAEANARKAQHRATNALTEWQKSHGYSDQRAADLVSAANALHVAAGGEPLVLTLARDPALGRELLEHAVEYDREIRRVQTAQRVNEAVLDATSTDVQAGLTVPGPDGRHVPVAPREPVFVQFDESRANSRAKSRQTTVGEMRRELVAPESTDWRFGLTAVRQSDGKVVSGAAALEESMKPERERLEALAAAERGWQW